MNDNNKLSKLTFLMLMALALITSYIPILSWPLEWFETFFHEISHGLMALLTGGSIARIELHLMGSGLCYTVGGVHFLVSFSGYAGAVMWGALLYMVVGVANPWKARTLVASLGILVVGVTVFWVRDLISLFIVAMILGLVIAAYAAGRYRLSQLAIRFIAVYVMLSAARTPLSLIDGRSLGDGDTLATLTGIPEIVWVLIWEAIALSTLWLVYRAHGTKHEQGHETGTSAVVETS